MKYKNKINIQCMDELSFTKRIKRTAYEIQLSLFILYSNWDPVES